MSIARFFSLSALIAVVLNAAVYIVQSTWLDERSFMAMLAAILVAFFTTLLAYLINYPNLKKPNKNFIAAMMLGMFSKMAFGLISIVIVAIQFKAVLFEYVVCYILAYFIFTAFEVYSLMRKLRA